jgi:hypothetical protein
MATTGAVRATAGDLPELAHFEGAVTRATLREYGVGPAQARANLDAGRWQRVGTAVVLHSGPLTTEQRREVARINCGPRSVFTSFTTAEAFGLRGWERDEVHVLAPAGARSPRLPGLPVCLHRTPNWGDVEIHRARRSHQLAPALVVAASSFADPRSACGILAAAVQQRLASVAPLRVAVERAIRSRHRGTLLAALDDIAQGSQALSEIDFVRLCRRFKLPGPEQQTVRTERNGRRRYLDATWRRHDGRLVVVEVDGALHLSVQRWRDDQMRQNEIALGGALVLRFPSVVVRAEPGLVAEQLRRALELPRR